MGKVRRQRQKFHLSAKKQQNSSKSKIDIAENPPPLPIPSHVVFPSEAFSQDGTGNLDFLGQRLPDKPNQEDDRMTYISKKSINDEGQMKKKDKKKIRHERWLQKIDTIKQAKKSHKAAKQRSQAPVVGDLHLLSQALPELSQVLRLEGGDHKQQPGGTRSQKAQKRKANTLKTKERRKLLLKEQANFKLVLNHSEFKQNPLATINEHLRNKMRKEQEEMEDNT